MRRTPTSALLISAAFAAVQALIFVMVVPITSLLAVSSPPAYALVAAVHTAMPLLARVVTRVPGMATFTAAVTGLLTSVVSPIGPIAVVPMVCAALALDLVLPLHRGRTPSAGRIVLAAAVAGVVLFLVALPVFSPEHLTPPVLMATLGARLAGESAVAAGVIGVRRLLVRAGAIRGDAHSASSH
nr:ECF transporter S component [Microbacterium hydrocarbonoxydans]